MNITVKSIESNRGLHGAYVFEGHDVDRLVGELLTLIAFSE